MARETRFGCQIGLDRLILAVKVIQGTNFDVKELVNKICGFTIVYGFYFTQCVGMGSNEHLTLS